ncbi:MAG: molybdenum cofactor guanylyltransferase MobA [Gammaproteobacteria bacterium]
MTDNKKHDFKDITGIILAGGRAQRMSGQDKGLLPVFGQTMIKLVIVQLEPQVKTIIINANRNIEKYQQYNYPVISDHDSKNFHGPLAGMLSTMLSSNTKYILTAPCDSPFIPTDYSSRMLSALLEHQADICVVHDGHRMQPVFALIKTRLADSLQHFLDKGDRKIDLWYSQHKTQLVDFSDCDNLSININTPDELAKLEQLFSERKQAC